ncbi:MAG TPA: MFS transporter [Candidatus Limnocylindria bacterium]
MPRILPDIEPLRVSRDYRLLWSGQLISQAGSAVRLVAIPYQIYLLTQSSFAVGLIGLFSAIPLILLSLFGGVIADRVDRRRLLLVTQTCLCATSLALAVSTQLGFVSVPLLYALTAIGAGFGALDGPARAAVAPTLVERRLIPSVAALNQTLWRVGSIVGPALAGVVIGVLGLSAAYWLDAATFLAAILAIAVMHVPAIETTEAPAHPLRALTDGVRFVLARPLLLSTMAVDFFAMFFGIARALMPYYADRVFHVGPEGLGLLYAAPGIGATVMVLMSGWTKDVERKGLGVLASVVVFGVAMALFGVVGPSGFLVGCLLLAIGEGADTVSTIFRWTILQMETPDAYRGRLASINFVFVAGGPQLGQVESGLVADLFTPEISVVTGGLACVAVAFVAGSLVPQLVRYRSEEPVSSAA